MVKVWGLDSGACTERGSGGRPRVQFYGVKGTLGTI